MYKDRAELNEFVVRNALSPDAEPLPGYGRIGMSEIRKYYGELAVEEGMAQFLRNHPSMFHF